jgi:hypothetical protein
MLILVGGFKNMTTPTPTPTPTTTTTTTTTPSAAPTAVTAEYGFCPTGPRDENGNRQCLFSVRAGVPLTRALDELSSLISSSIASIDNLACTSDDTDGMPGALWQSSHLLNFSFALIQSIHNGHKAQTKVKS